MSTSHNREESIETQAHDIFLSHSGKQKGFVNDLYKRLTSSYTVFFDIADHSLPPAEKFPPHIFEAARKCKLAVVVLSTDFVVSYWPMLELCAFVRAAPSVKILPLFYQLSPSDLKNEDNLKKWREIWNTHATQQSNSRHTLDVLEWEKALKSLCSLNGIICNPSIEGEQAYLDTIVSKISKIVPPALKYDDLGIHGKDRLCKNILVKFAELEVRALQPSNKQSAPPQSRVCILAMYGLPGSGKSTLSKCLCNHYFPYFDGKAIYIDLPTKPTNEQLATKCKEFLDRLTNFRNMLDLTHASDLTQIYYVLRTSNLQRSRIFLVLDNISKEALQFVQKILSFGVGPGSKVLLVARTLDVLESFRDPQREQSHYVSASINVPSLDEKEAVRVLLQSRDNEDLADHDFTSCDRQIMEKVVRMSGFGKPRLYLPLVMKIMGVQLRQYKLDVKRWGDAMDSIWTKVEKCKERAVMELVQESFLQLSKCLQLLFLDLSLFIRRLSESDHGRLQACNILSRMHERSPDDIIFDLYDLRRHCFVEDVNAIRIHDVFLEFAASIPESSMYYASCRSCIHVNNMLPPPSCQALEYFGLRTVVLELDEGHERFDFWPGFSNVKALVFRNCKQLAVLGLKGLTSLVILHIDNCPSLKSVELPAREADYRNLLDSIQWLRCVDTQGEKNMAMQHKKSNNIVQMYAEQGKQVVNNAWSWLAGMIGASRIENPARMVVGDFAFKMRMLQVLDLQNTGIKHLGDMSMCWPALNEVTIIEKSLEHIEVGTLPCLKRFAFLCDNGIKSNDIFVDNHGGDHMYCKLRRSPRGFKRKNLLVGCPALEDVVIRSAFFEDNLGMLVTPKLRSLWLSNFWHAEKLPNLGACAESLQRLMVQECGELRSVDFMYRFERLTKFYLVGCPSITEVSGLDCLPSLNDLYIDHCINLQALRGLSGLVSLEYYKVGMGCPNLQVLLSDLEGLTNLMNLDHRCNTLIRPGGFNVRKLVNLWWLVLPTNNISAFGNLFIGLEGLEGLGFLRMVTSDVEVMCETHCHTLVDMATLLGVPEPPHLSHLTSILELCLEGVQNLASLRGIGFLRPLETLELKSLQNLSCFQGIECLTNLRTLLVKDCGSVEELPSLSQLVNMSWVFIENCVKLRSIEGCGAMTNLRQVVLIGCKSMACFPLDYTTLGRLSPLGRLRVEGSKFASREVMLSWILEDEKPTVLRKASVEALKWELCCSLREKRDRMELAVVLLESLREKREQVERERMEMAVVLLERLDRTLIPSIGLLDLLDLLDVCEQVAQGNDNTFSALESLYFSPTGLRGFN